MPKIVESLRGGYGVRDLRGDVFAGVTVGVVALPLAMAFAIASGATPGQGLFTAIVAGLVISLFSGSRYQIGGPTGAFVVIVFDVLHRHGPDGLALATLIAGVLLLIIAFSGLGGLIQYIPYPVITGFTTGIAVIIFSSQLKDFFGLQLGQTPADFIHKWAAMWGAARSVNWHAAAVGGGSLGLLILLRRFCPRVPGALVAVVLSSAVVALLHLPVETIGSRFGDIPSMLPRPRLPGVDLAGIQAVLPAAFTIAILAAIESLLSAVVADGMTGDRHRPNAEVLAQGLANIASVLFGGIPATGAIARTATNIRSGAFSPVSGVIHALTLLGIMVVAAPLARSIPLAALAGILIMVAYNMSEWEKFRHLLKAPRSDTLVLLTTFALTVLVDLTVAIEVGLLMAALLFMKRMVEVSSVGRLGWLNEDEMEPGVMARRMELRDVEAYEIAGPFFFGIADRFKGVLSELERPPKVFILRMRHVPAMDATGLHALRTFYDRCRRGGTTLLLSGVQDQPRRAMKRMGLDELISHQNICANIEEAMDRAQEILSGGNPSMELAGSAV